MAVEKQVMMRRMNSESQMELAPVILVAEDEETVLSFLCRVLEADGYYVLTARNSVEALQIGAAFKGAIDVLLSDVCMRVFQNGLELARCFNLLRPETAVLLTSGSALPGNGIKNAEWEFLPKPFSAPRLLSAIDALMARKQNSRDWVPKSSREIHLA